MAEVSRSRDLKCESRISGVSFRLGGVERIDGDSGVTAKELSILESCDEECHVVGFKSPVQAVSEPFFWFAEHLPHPVRSALA